MHGISFEIEASFFKKIFDTQGKYFSSLSGLDTKKIVADFLNPVKAMNQANILSLYVEMETKKVLEIGSGLGVNHIVWTKSYGIDGYGIEPDAIGFESSYKISKELIQFNGLNPEKIIDAVGECIPFDNDSFDIVYSTNVLEHVQNPGKVIDEALRVLKPGGTMQIVYPNYHSYFDGHYAVFHPPLIFKGFFPWYVKSIWGRDPEFANTLRTELNIFWTKKRLKYLKTKYQIKVLSLGEDIFLDRMQTLDFETWGGLTKVQKMLNLINNIGLIGIAAKVILSLRGWNPIILTLRKLPDV
jgi:SAM-dependent methyltransferase